MTSSPDPPSEPLPDAELARARTIGVGCFMAFLGFWSGGMVFVLLGKFVEGARRSPVCEGLPICNWYLYAAAGAVLGAISLPVLVLRRMRRRDSATRPSS
jgi:hypothetical protein